MLFRSDQIRTKVINTLTTYANSSDVNSFGGRFKYSKVVSLIDGSDTSITSNITKVKMRLNVPPTLNVLATYNFCFGNQVHIKQDGYSIKSSGFYIDGVSEPVYMADMQTTSTSGRIFFFKLENNVPIMVKNNAGTIDYKTGEVSLLVTKITGTELSSGVIEVQAVPESNDVIGLKYLYLQIDIQNTVVNTVEDIVSSGENTSATKFVPTSSYLNGKYTR